MQLIRKLKFTSQLIKTVGFSIYSGTNLYTLLRSIRNKTFLYYDKDKMSYEELYIKTKQTALKLQSIDQYPNQAILCADNSFDFIIHLCALSAVYSEIILVNPNLSKKQYQNLLSKTKANLILTEDKDIFNDIDFQGKVYSFKDIETIQSVSNELQEKKNNCKISILSTGTSNLPKPIERKLNILKILNPFFELIEKIKLVKYNSSYISIPFHHGYGLASLILGLFLKQEIHFSSKFSTKSLIKAISNHKIDCLIVIPSMLPKILNENPNSLMNINCIISGADQLHENWIKTILSQYQHIDLFNLYGTSELGIISIATTTDLKRNPLTLGNMIKGIQYKLDQNESFYVKSPWMYDHNREEYLPTGDKIHLDSEKQLFHLGRINPSVNIKGEIINFIEIENLLRSYPLIKESKVRPFKNEHMITQLQFDIIAENAKLFDEKAFQNWLYSNIPSYMYPEKINVKY